MSAITAERILDRLAVADCNCEPGDGTCEDWPSRIARLRRLAEAVAAELDGETLPVDPADVRLVTDSMENIRIAALGPQAFEAWCRIRSALRAGEGS